MGLGTDVLYILKNTVKLTDSVERLSAANAELRNPGAPSSERSTSSFRAPVAQSSNPGLRAFYFVIPRVVAESRSPKFRAFYRHLCAY